MSNATPIRTHIDATRVARADFVQDCLKSDRWSVRKASLALGMTHTVLGSRVKGETSFLAEEIEAIAGILKRDPVEFFAAYISAGNGEGPASEETGPVMLPHLDSNQEPAGSEPDDSPSNVTHVVFGSAPQIEHETAGEVIHADFGRAL